MDVGPTGGGGAAGPAVFPAYPCLVWGEGGIPELYVWYTSPPHPARDLNPPHLHPASILPVSISPAAVPLPSPVALLLLPAVCVSTPALSPPSFLPLSQPITEAHTHHHTPCPARLRLWYSIPSRAKEKTGDPSPALSDYSCISSTNSATSSKSSSKRGPATTPLM